jgi:hypothetical protein
MNDQQTAGAYRSGGYAALATLLEFCLSTLHPEALAGGLSAAFRSDTHHGTSLCKLECQTLASQHPITSGGCVA